MDVQTSITSTKPFRERRTHNNERFPVDDGWSKKPVSCEDYGDGTQSEQGWVYVKIMQPNITSAAAEQLARVASSGNRHAYQQYCSTDPSSWINAVGDRMLLRPGEKIYHDSNWWSWVNPTLLLVYPCYKCNETISRPIRRVRASQTMSCKVSST